MLTERGRIVQGILLFVIPLAGACLPLVFVDLLAPRGEAAKLTEAIAGPINFGANVIAAFYYVAISAAVTVVVCAITIWCCAHWLVTVGIPEAEATERKWILVGIGVALLIPLVLLSLQYVYPGDCNKFDIDDCVTKSLFKKTIWTVYHPPLAMNQDANILAAVVFATYLLAVVTVSTAAASYRGLDKQPTSEKIANDRASTLNLVLFLIAAVLVAAMVTAKFRFDVGLATLPISPKDNPAAPAFQAYQTIASAIMTYWASVLSLCLALIYLPSAYILAMRKNNRMGAEIGSFFSFNRENGIRLLKLAAIVSPPIINKLIETFAVIPKS